MELAMQERIAVEAFVKEMATLPSIIRQMKSEIHESKFKLETETIKKEEALNKHKEEVLKNNQLEEEVRIMKQQLKSFQAEKKEREEDFQTEKKKLEEDFQAEKKELGRGFQIEKKEMKEGFQIEKKELKEGFQIEKKELKEGFQIEKKELKEGFQIEKKELKEGFQIEKKELEEYFQIEWKEQEVKIEKITTELQTTYENVKAGEEDSHNALSLTAKTEQELKDMSRKNKILKHGAVLLSKHKMANEHNYYDDRNTTLRSMMDKLQELKTVTTTCSFFRRRTSKHQLINGMKHPKRNDCVHCLGPPPPQYHNLPSSPINNQQQPPKIIFQ